MTQPERTGRHASAEAWDERHASAEAWDERHAARDAIESRGRGTDEGRGPLDALVRAVRHPA